jgi:hypothetical protein
VKGWNTRDPLAEMDPLYAIRMDNWVPGDDEVNLRAGSEEHATGVGSGAVETLLIYNGLTGTDKMFAAGNSAIYDVSTSGAVGAAAVSSLTNNRWQYVNFGTAGGQFLWMVNGADGVRTYNGSSWATQTVTGVTPANLIWCNVHHRRIFAGEKDSLEFAYFPVNTISGSMSTFSLAGLATKGGYLMGMATWTGDAGDGIDDYAIFVTSEGQAIVYTGINPASASDWILKGVYEMGKPIGRRFWVPDGGDVIFITQDGFEPASALMVSREARRSRSISNQITPTVNTATRNYSANFGWEAIAYPQSRWLLFNIPISENETAHQYVFNSTSRAPCRFKGWNANCFAVFNDDLYFGGIDGRVMKADTGTDDDGSNIDGDIKPAFNYFGNKARLKLFKMARPIFNADGDFEAAFDMNVDFEDAIPTATPTFTDPDAALWNNFNWNEANWGGGGGFVSKDWQSITGVGYSGALRIRVSTKLLSISMRSIDYVFEEGGVL